MTRRRGQELVRSYLDAMVARRWDELATTLAPDVVRLGPFQDDIRGREEYVTFLRRTFDWMQDYEMDVARVWGDDERVCAELAETVTVDGDRRRTDEALVFVLADGLIARVAIYLRRSTSFPKQ